MQSPPTKTLLVILGPTAVGKTALSIQLARHYGTSILSADSRQFFKEMNIGTAKPNKTELASVAHYFVDFLSIHDSYDAATFETEALTILEKLFKEKDLVILSGGSGMYADALCKGFDEMPETNPAIRENLNNLYKEKGIRHLQELLEKHDPVYYRQVDLNNPQRIIRGLEVFFSTNKPFSDFRKKGIKARPFKIIYIGLSRDKEELYQRINLRVENMMNQGLLEEVKGLLPYFHLNALQTVGYREFFDYFQAKANMETVVEKIAQNTRRYAKRQMTWFRKNKEIKWFHPDAGQEIIQYVNRVIESEDIQPI
ncbi:MAG: tRNA (adenosine(37)-N6)-dimethylallyltransferase MiaA [Bacteroidetes bacterium]|nr:tRNA (adenosine(37)-N6)-dimethylallyltransferase MiaA [Bacteroidota bacterium]